MGALPFLHGDGGVGALPFAMMTAPLSRDVTADFRPIAPTRTSIARARTASCLDIVPPRYTTTTEVQYLFKHQCQAARQCGLKKLRASLPDRVGRTEVRRPVRKGAPKRDQHRAAKCAGQQYRSTRTHPSRDGLEAHTPVYGVLRRGDSQTEVEWRQNAAALRRLAPALGSGRLDGIGTDFVG